MAHDFIEELIFDQDTAIKGLKMTMEYMDAQQSEKFLDHLADVIVEKGVSPELLNSILVTLGFLDDNNS